MRAVLDNLRYCDATCQHDHWRRGHKQICKKIHRGGNAEQFHANKKYKEAVAVAVEACAVDTKGQKCYICLEAVHPLTGEGLVRGCACHAIEGSVHVSCLAEQAEVLVAGAIDLDYKVLDARWNRWSTCSLCEQNYHGVVACALGWACWKTYCDSVFGHVALNLLATSMMKDERWEEGLLVHQAQLAKLRTEFPVNQEGVIDVLNNLKECYCWNFCGNHGTSSSTGVSMISRRRRVWRTITTVSTSTRPTPRVKPTRRTLQKYSRFCKTCKLQILLK